MTMQHTETVSCPHCGHPQEFNICQTLNATLNPDLKERLLNRQLTLLTCERCGHQADVIYSLLYHDMTRRFMIWLVVGEGRPQPLDPSLAGTGAEQAVRDYRYRLVRSRNELAEKVLIFDADLDDRILELCKAILRHSEGGVGQAGDTGLFYDGTHSTPSGEREIRFVLVGGVEPRAFALKPGVYDNLRSRFAPLLPEEGTTPSEWLEVNQDYALQILSALVGEQGARDG